MQLVMKHGFLWVTRVLFSFVVFSQSSLAAEKFEFFNGIRMLGMGGASIAVANDETAVFSNPAALGKLRDPFFTIIDPEIELGEDTSSFLTGFDLNVLGLEAILTKINEHPGRNFHLRTQIFPSIVVPNFAAGVMLKYEINGTLNTTTSEIELNYRNDFVGVLGYDLRLFDGRLKVGFSARYINRSEITDKNPIATSNLARTIDDTAQNGGALAADAGIIITMPWRWLPTLAVVGRDLGNTSFSLGAGFASGDGTDPETVKQSIDASIAIFPIMGNRARTTITVEMRDILSDDEDDKADVMRRLHTGVELNFSDIFFIRGGLNQRYWTAGVEFAIMNIQFQIASYGEEVGTATTPAEDRRYLAKFSYRF